MALVCCWYLYWIVNNVTKSNVYEWACRTLGCRATEYLCTLLHIPVYVYIVKYHHYFRRQACDKGIFSDALHKMHVFQSATPDAFKWTTRTLGCRAPEYLCTLHHIQYLPYVAIMYERYATRRYRWGVINSSSRQQFLINSSRERNTSVNQMCLNGLLVLWGVVHQSIYAHCTTYLP